MLLVLPFATVIHDSSAVKVGVPLKAADVNETVPAVVVPEVVGAVTVMRVLSSEPVAGSVTSVMSLDVMILTMLVLCA